MGGTPITVATSHKYLGANFTNNFCWREHNGQLTSILKGNRPAGLLRLDSSSFAVQGTVDLSYVRPVLEYASPVRCAARTSGSVANA